MAPDPTHITDLTHWPKDKVEEFGISLLRAQLDAERRVESARAALAQAEKDVKHFGSRFAKFYCPKDACRGEEYTQWIGDGLVRFQVIERTEGEREFRVLGWRLPMSPEFKERNRLL